MTTYQPPNTAGGDLPTNIILGEDVDTIRQQLNEYLTLNSDNTNQKEIGVYTLNEILNNQQWFIPDDTQSFRRTFRKVFNITTAITAGSTESIAHEITEIVTFTRMYGTAIVDDANPYRPIPYVSVTAADQGIELNANDTSFNIINGAAAPDIISAIIVLEYLKE